MTRHAELTAEALFASPSPALLRLRHLADALGRSLIGGIFALDAGLNLRDWPATLAAAASHGVPFAPASVLVAMGICGVCGLALLLGWRTRLAALALAAFVAVVTPVFHHFWTFGGAVARSELNVFLIHLALLGALLAIAARGPGRLSIDARHCW